MPRPRWCVSPASTRAAEGGRDRAANEHRAGGAARSGVRLECRRARGHGRVDNARGNITAAAEYNIYVDPESAAIVVEAGFASLRFTTWDPLSLQQAVFDTALIDSIRALGTPRSDFFVTRIRRPSTSTSPSAWAAPSHCDPLSVLAALDRRVDHGELDLGVVAWGMGEQRILVGGTV